ncbi:MAG: flavodoxin [Acholeplasmatales bacterium]|nr:flavodoxin [Acholeplasmatales bacterium]
MKSLVAYFSASGVTKKAALDLAKAKDADLFEIEPVKKYTSEDLDWTNKSSRSSIEMNDKSSRPEIIRKDLDVDLYDTIYVGFPIWWYTAPTIINTFLETYNFKNKKIVLFATSGGSRFCDSLKDLKVSVDSSNEIVEGKILNYYSTIELKNL